MKSWILYLNFCLDDIEICLIIFLKNEKIVTKDNAIFIKFMQSFEPNELLLAKLSFSKAHLLFAVSYTGHKAIFIRFIWIYNFVVLQKLKVIEHVLYNLLLFNLSFHTVIYQIIYESSFTNHLWKFTIFSIAISLNRSRPRISKYLLYIPSTNVVNF